MMGRLRYLLLSLGVQALSAATLSVYMSAPDVMTTFVGGATTQSFDNQSLGAHNSSMVTGVGTYQGTPTSIFQIVNEDAYGGVPDNGNRRYFAIGAQSGTAGAVALQLTGNYNYFGFWWSAGDANNGVTFYTGATQLARLSTADLVNLLSPQNGSVTAVNGATYANSAYYGKPPNSAQNAGEPYAYVHVITSGVTFNRVVFDNSNSTGTGFESDNHSLYNGVVSVVNTGNVHVRDFFVAPEPGTLGLCFIGLAFILKSWKSRGTKKR